MKNYALYTIVLSTFFSSGAAFGDENDYTRGFADGYAAGYAAGGGGQQSQGAGFPLAGGGFPSGGGNQMEGFEEWIAKVTDSGALPDYLAVEVREAAGLSYASGAATPFYFGNDDTDELWDSMSSAGAAMGLEPNSGRRVLFVPIQPLANKQDQMTIRMLGDTEEAITTMTVNPNDWFSALRGLPIDAKSGVTLIDKGIMGTE